MNNKNIHRILLIITLGLAVPSTQAIELDKEIIINAATVGVAIVCVTGYALLWKLYLFPKFAQEKLKLKQELAHLIAEIKVIEQSISEANSQAKELDQQLINFVPDENIYVRIFWLFWDHRLTASERRQKAVENIPQAQPLLAQIKTNQEKLRTLAYQWRGAMKDKKWLERALGKSNT